MIHWEVVLWTCITLAVMMALIGVVLVSMSSRGLKQKKQSLANLHEKLQAGSHVMFSGGIYGKVTGIEGDIVHVEVAEGTVIRISRYAIQALDDPN